MVWFFLVLLLAGTVMAVSMTIWSRYWSEIWGPVLPGGSRLSCGVVRLIGVLGVVVFTMPAWAGFLL